MLASGSNIYVPSDFHTHTQGSETEIVGQCTVTVDPAVFESLSSVTSGCWIETSACWHSDTHWPNCLNMPPRAITSSSGEVTPGQRLRIGESSGGGCSGLHGPRIQPKGRILLQGAAQHSAGRDAARCPKSKIAQLPHSPPCLMQLHAQFGPKSADKDDLRGEFGPCGCLPLCRLVFDEEHLIAEQITVGTTEGKQRGDRVR